MPSAKIGLLRSHTTRNITTSNPPPESKPSANDDIKVGIVRSATDPVTEETRRLNAQKNDASSGHSSGTSSPRRKPNSMDVVRNFRENPTSAIPKYHILAEQVHRFKMRNCPGMEATVEEQQGIKEMKKWSWKSCGRPGPCPLPVGPKDETWYRDPVEDGE